jgi:GR25 family glycosyltransferase involved in LPS biosynthesis
MTILAAYCINLDRRTDRWIECEDNYQSQGLPPGLIQRWSACEDAEHGALGCARSHFAALSNFLTHRYEPFCLIMEDDFDFLRNWNSFAETFNGLLQNQLDWDVLLLAGTCTIAYPENSLGVARIFESQSASGYLLQRSYVPMVLHSFARSIVMLEKFRANQPREHWVAKFAIDQLWKQLQHNDRWFISSPVVGHQRPSFSDIEKKIVDYAALGFRGVNN